MTTSKRLSGMKVARFQRNISKKGSKKGNGYTGGLILLGFIVFVVVGSSLFLMLRNAARKGKASTM